LCTSSSPFDDGDRAGSFSEEAFGWQVQEMPERSYTLVTTGPRTPVGAMGFTAYVRDPEGNVIGLWETAGDT
jgi:uncharacterized protein